MPDVKKSWDKIARLYREKYPIASDTIHYGPLCPGENKLNLLGDIAGLRCVDLGCGGGQNTVAMARAGADATGVDFSLQQLAEADKLAREERVAIRLINSDIISVPALDNRSFDMALSACAIAFVKRFDLVIKEAHRILKPDGRFVLSVMHPFQYIIDGEEGTMYFNSTYPFSSRLLKWSWDFAEKSVPFQHYLRSISEYHNALVDAGFEVMKILEPKPTLNTPHRGLSEEIMKEYPYIAKHLPITLILLAQKIDEMKKRE